MDVTRSGPTSNRRTDGDRNCALDQAWLGPGNRFTSDRINRLLLASYGRQDVRVAFPKAVDAGRIFRAEKLNADDYWALAKGDIDCPSVDMRLSTALPVLGFYFEPWEQKSAARYRRRLAQVQPHRRHHARLRQRLHCHL